MAVTIYDLAKAADCSISTVSKALNDSYTVSDATKEKIRALAEELGYASFEQLKSVSSFVFPTVRIYPSFSPRK